MELLNKITPNFLKTIDRYLLLNAPVVWRTRIHYLLFSFIFGNAAILAFMYVLPISKANVPSINTISNFASISFAFLGFAALYWAYTQFKYKLNSVHFSSKLTTYVLYLVGILVLASHYVTLHSMLLHKVANVADPVEFEQENAYLYKHNLQYKYEKTPVEFNEKATKIYAAYGIDVLQDNPDFDRHLYAKESIREAQYFTVDYFDNDFYRWTHRDFAVSIFLALLGIPGFFLILSYGKVADFFIVSLIHFFTFLSFIIINTLYLTKVEVFYSVITSIIAVAALAFLKNSRKSKIAYFSLLLAIPLTTWFYLIGKTSGFSAKSIHSTMQGGQMSVLLPILLSIGLSILFFHLMSRKLNRPKT